MSPVLELAVFPSSDALRANPSLLDKTFSMASNAKGSQFVSNGLQAEDGTTAYIAVVWDSLDDHYTLMQNKTLYEPLVESMKPAIGGKADIMHVQLTDSSAAVTAISAPATEIAFFTLKGPEQASVLPGSMEELMEALGAAPSKQGYTWGKVVEKEDAYVLIIGWDSVDAHWDTVKNYAPVNSAVQKVFESVTSDLIHVHFKKYTA